MPNRPFYPPPWQIPALLDGRATLVVVPLKEQRPPGARAVSVLRYPESGGTIRCFEWRSKYDSYWGDIALPFAPGDTLVCRETFAWSGFEELVVGTHYKHCPERSKHRDNLAIYRIDKPGRAQGPLHGKTVWRSPATMPQWAVRLRLRVTEDVRVCRTTDLSPADAIACGFGPYANSLTIDCDTRNPLDDLRAAWDRRYARKSGLAFGDGPWVETGKVERVER